MDEQQLRAINAIWTDAMQANLDDDHLFELFMLMDPDGSIDQAIRGLEEADWQRERAAMTAEQRQSLDEATERGIARGMEIVRRILAEQSARSDESPA